MRGSITIAQTAIGPKYPDFTATGLNIILRRGRTLNQTLERDGNFTKRHYPFLKARQHSNKMTAGGKRKGAGRKPRATPLEAITIRIEPEHAKRFRAICKAKGRSQAQQFTEWVKNDSGRT